ncbi:MAG TPA: hypothetical protein VIF10_10690 [Methylobacter sp.]|jgi:hypothetical protein
MVELGITVVLVALLIAIMVFLNKRKKSSSGYASNQPFKYAPKEPLKKEAKYPPQQEKQPSEIKPAPKVEVKAEPTAVNSQITDAKAVASSTPKPVKKPVSNIEASTKPQAKEAASPAKNSNTGFPEDSVLKRHFFNHLCTMIEELAPQCPTDSVLRRHYYTMLVTQIDQCLNDKKSMERLIYNYENRSA